VKKIRLKRVLLYTPSSCVNANRPTLFFGKKKPRAGDRLGANLNRSDHGSFRVNQVEMPFMPFRSTLLPSQTAKATGTDMPPLNCTSLGSFVASARFTTMRQVGPVQQPPLIEPAGSQSP